MVLDSEGKIYTLFENTALTFCWVSQDAANFD